MPGMTISRELIDCAGGPSEVARKLQVTPQAVHRWGRTAIPPDRVIDVIELLPVTDRVKFKPGQIRPDVFKYLAA